MLNRISLIGYVGQDAITKATPSGKEVVTFSLATTSGKPDNKKTIWHSIEVWGQYLIPFAKVLTKGKLVYVEGLLDITKREDKTYIKVLANYLVPGPLPSDKPKASSPAYEESNGGFDDIPF